MTIAIILAGGSGSRMGLDIPKQFIHSKATKARLDGHKLQALGWKPAYDIRGGIERTIQILGSLQ